MTVQPGAGLVLIQRLHRLVRHGFRPWLGYDVQSTQDRTVHLRRHDLFATVLPDATVILATPHRPAVLETVLETISGTDSSAFDTRFPANTANKRNIIRRLYEIGFLAPR